MKTYKIVYTIANKPGRHVTFYESVCADFARQQAREELGGWDIVTIWEVTEVNFQHPMILEMLRLGPSLLSKIRYYNFI